VNRKTDRGVSMIIVLAALIVTGFLGSAMLKLSTGGQLSNGNYSTSAKARSAANSGITAAIQSLEGTNPSSSVIPKLQNWINSSRGLEQLEQSSRWLYGAASGTSSWKTLDGSLEYRVEIVGFDPQKFNVALRSEGKGRGGSRAVATAVYHLEGLEYQTTTYPNNALQADGGIHEGNNYQININGGAQIDFAGVYPATSFNLRGGLHINGPFRTVGGPDGSREFKVNGPYHFHGPSYFRNLVNLAGGTVTCYDKYYKQSGSQTITGGTAQSTLEATGLTEAVSPAITFNRGVASDGSSIEGSIYRTISGDPVEAHRITGDSLNVWWNAANSANPKRLYRGKYLVVRVNNSSNPSSAFKGGGTPFAHKVIVLVDGDSKMQQWVDCVSTSVSVLYFTAPTYSQRNFDNVRNFYGYIHVNTHAGSSSDHNMGFTIGRQPFLGMYNNYADVPDYPEVFNMDFYGAIYASSTARMRFEGGFITNTTTGHQVFLGGVGGQYYPGTYTIHYRSSIMNPLVDDRVIFVVPVGANNGTWQNGTLTTKPGVTQIAAGLVSQSM